MKYLVSAIALSASVCFSGVSYAQEEPYVRNVVVYVAEDGDTIQSIAETYIKKNTYGQREIREFKSGIVEENPWLVDRKSGNDFKVQKGDRIEISYWVKK